MPWILLLLALACVGAALSTTSVGLAWAALLAALGLLVAGALTLADRRLARRSRDTGSLFDAGALREYRVAAGPRDAGSTVAAGPSTAASPGARQPSR